MSSYRLCAACARHVRRSDSTCPLCGAEFRVRSEAAVGRAKRTSRAEWLAFGGSAVALVGCTGHVASSTTNRQTAIGDVAQDMTTATETGGPGFSCVAYAALPYDDAATHACNRATEWCYTNHNYDPTGCVPFTSKCGLPCTTPCIDVISWDAAACGGDVPHCACVSVTCASGSCSEDDAGAMTVSCGSCYGAPPTRLERVA